jgi:HSP20 family protein
LRVINGDATRLTKMNSCVQAGGYGTVCLAKKCSFNFERYAMTSLRLFDSALTDPFDSLYRRMLAPLRGERPKGELDIRVDVIEKNGLFKVHADLPGVKKEDIHVRIDGNLVQIDAETREEKESKDSGGKLLCSERYYGAVSRAFTLAQDVDESKSTAKFENGVLTLELPKKTGTRTKQLTVN